MNNEETGDNVPGDDDLMGEEVPLEDFGGGGGTLGDALRNNPLMKIGVVVGGFAAIIAGVALFGGEKEPAKVSIVGGGAQVKDVPGADAPSKSYREAVEETNIQAVEQAIKEGGSALPTPVTPAIGRVPVTDNLEPAEDPLERWRRIQEERQRRDMQKQGLDEGDQSAEAVNALSQAMSQQMSSILTTKLIKSMKSASITAPDFLDEKGGKDKDTGGGGKSSGGAGDGKEDMEIIEIILPAGTIEYAQLITEANSDVPGPVLAQVVSGPLKGSRILGGFETHDEGDEYLTLDFDTIVIDGISHPIDAIAINPDTANPGMVTEVDHRYFSRVILPAAASFIEGVGSAIAETGGTRVTVDNGTVIEEKDDLNSREEFYKGVGKAASKVSEFVDDEASKIKVLIRVAPGTPIGVLFVDAVTDENS